MTRRKRAAVLLALAVVLGTLSATHMSRREAALRAQLGPVAEVVVARRDLPAGRTLQLADLGVRALPARYAPAGEPVFAAALAGQKLAVPVPQGGDGHRGAAAAATPEEPPVERGERAVEIVASGTVAAGARVDVLVSDRERGDPARARRTSRCSRPSRRRPRTEGGGPRTRATLRVPIDDAVFLVAAQAYAQDVRLLARIPGDTRTDRSAHRRPGALRSGRVVISTEEELFARARELASQGGRRILGIAGKPGGGKSTVARAVVAELADRARLVPMDGFHLAQPELVRLGRRDRMGAPDTFDAAGYAALLTRLRSDEPTVYAPEFRREIEEPIAGAIAVPREVPLVVTEGNYLLLWRGRSSRCWTSAGTSRPTRSCACSG